jgi:DNA-binding transcriptional MerR regulator/methylmalonyl-CoA mutase cobalamin-binding subunit
MYTIKEASARTGVGTSLIRAWERRYGVIKPTRAASGYRLYDDATLQVLLAMRLLVESGWTASEAARAIGAGEVELDEIAGEPVVARIPATSVDAHRTHLIARFVEGAGAASNAGTEAALDEMFASGSYEAVIDDLVLPAAAALGDAWVSGRLSVAAEHAASAAVARRLGAAYQAAGVSGRTTVVVGLPPGSRHELGALAFAVALRRRGVGVLYLGQDVTVEGWVDATTRTRAKAAVVGVVTDGDVAAATAVADALRALNVPVVALGGAAGTADTASRLGVVALPQRVVDAAATIANTVARRR